MTSDREVGKIEDWANWRALVLFSITVFTFLDDGDGVDGGGGKAEAAGEVPGFLVFVHYPRSISTGCFNGSDTRLDLMWSNRFVISFNGVARRIRNLRKNGEIVLEQNGYLLNCCDLDTNEINDSVIEVNIPAIKEELWLVMVMPYVHFEPQFEVDDGLTWGVRSKLQLLKEPKLVCDGLMKGKTSEQMELKLYLLRGVPRRTGTLISITMLLLSSILCVLGIGCGVASYGGFCLKRMS
ncbi:hypothetical protein Droror1_Dr00011474 [Drosera rotundifolia]